LTEFYDRKAIMEILSKKNWISPHRKVVAVVEAGAGVAEVVEDHARGMCLGGSAWSLYHYSRNSKSVFWSKREGTRLFYKLHTSTSNAPMDLQASYHPASIESAVVEGNKVKVTYSGLAGAGVAALSRGMAEGVLGVEVNEWGGGKKLGRATLVLPLKEKVIIGVDDTDKADEGATWALVNEIAFELSKKPGVDYLEHSIVQLYPQNPFKTQNCVSIAVSFAVPPGTKGALVKDFRAAIKARTFSKETGMAWFNGVIVPEALMAYAKRAKSEMVTIQDAKGVANENGVKIARVTGERGLIGAVAAIPYVECPDEAVKLPGG
jgi:methanogenesis imperfect marker protein 11